MSVTPESVLNIPIEAFIELLANSSGWQGWMEVSDAESAKANIHVEAAVGEADLPVAVISMPDTWRADAVASGVTYTWQERGSLTVLIEAAIPLGYRNNTKDSYYWFTNQLGAVIDGIMNLSGTGNYLNVKSVSYLHPPTRVSYEENAIGNHAMNVILSVEWGV